ncbi:hypothetical protein B7463_g6612, partial [Scytalidium lignicola]
MPRLVRRRPFSERLKAYLNPLDFWLWLSEEFETSNWESKQATPLALGLHFVLLIARANSGSSSKRSREDDVFGDVQTGSEWFSHFAAMVSYSLAAFSILNAIYTFRRKRHYRLFESSIDAPQQTPSARRVRVDSSPIASSPLRFLSGILGDTSAESRAHPDPVRDVWEIALWDPIPVCLRLFCLFSPGHVLVYWLFLPTTSEDPRPSVTVFTTLVLQVLLSLQLIMLQSNFSQQSKDASIIHKEVLSEYDTKYVHPRLNPLVRDVATQFSSGKDEVDTYAPTTIIKRGFVTNPNPNYSKFVDPDNTGAVPQRVSTPPGPFRTPATFQTRETTPLRHQPLITQPQFRQSSSVSTSTSTGDGGSLGVYSHANSPLKKASSMYDITGPQGTPRNSYELARREIKEERERRSLSPQKRHSSAHHSLFSQRLLDSDSSDRRTSASAEGLKARHLRS